MFGVGRTARRRGLGVAVALAGWSVACAAAPGAGAAPIVLKQWDFDAVGKLEGWQAGGHVTDVRVAGGTLSARVADWDPILISPVFEIPARHAQWIETRIRTARGGRAEFFWTNTLRTKYGGFSPGKQTPFELAGDGKWHVYRVRPCWEPEGKIIRIRLDLPPARGPKAPKPLYEVDYVRIVELSQGAAAAVPEWTFARGAEGWTAAGRDEALEVRAGQLVLPAATAARTLAAPTVRFAASQRRFLTIRMSATAGKTGTVYFAAGGRSGLHARTFPLLADGQLHDYLVDLSAEPRWRGEIRLLMLQPTDAKSARVCIDAIRVTAQPAGRAELEVGFFGLADALARAGQELTISAAIRNRGGGVARDVVARLAPPPGLTCRDPAEQSLGAVWYGQTRYVRWRVRSAKPLAAKARLSVRRAGAAARAAEADVRIGPSLNLPPARTVPAPKPAKSDYQVGVYYFPGWQSWARWRPILDFPRRKPVLGWYDESNPEVADWQIKWAVEHGVRFFAVDWYWCRGSRQLEHWLHDAYFRSRYRKLLKFCLLWANHNPPGSHGADDLLAVTDYWIRRYFRLEEYLRIDGRAVVIVFTPYRLWKDMGTEAVAAAFAKMRRRCREAGVGGLYLIACTMSDRGTIQRLKAQGYDAVSGYNYPGLNDGGKRWASYASNIEGYRRLWHAAADLRLLREIPALSGGWDSRPWHGPSARVRFGRTPALFERHCREARAFLDKRDAGRDGEREKPAPAKTCIIEAWNEWGEGSYIGPHREYGFGYLQAIRRVFAPDSPEPLPVTPRDVGLGPYDLPGAFEAASAKTAWDFRKPGDRKDWRLGGQIKPDVGAETLAGVSTGSDPIIEGPVVRIDAAAHPWLCVEARCDRDETLQLFWSTTTAGASENNSVRVRLRGDGRLSTYWANLAETGCWTGLITRLRLDPVSGPGARFAVRSLRFASRRTTTRPGPSRNQTP